MSKTINKVIKVLILSDFFLLTGIGFEAPVFAIFLTERIIGGSVEVAGFASGIYWIINSLALIPIGRYLDKNHGEKDDLISVIIGNLLAALAVSGYFFSTYPWHIYALQALYGIGMAMNVAGYTAIFTRHIDKDREALEWSVRGAWVGVGGGVAGVIGGWAAFRYGFYALFAGVIIFIIISAVLPFLIYNRMSARNKPEPLFPGTKTLIQPPVSPKE